MATTTIQINRGAAANDGTGTPARDFALEFNNFNFSYGTYTPTFTNVANVAASTPLECQFLRIGDVVTVSGICDIDATAALTLTRLGISLPIASNFANARECGGVAASLASFVDVAAAGGILADATNNRAELSFFAGVNASNASYSFHFTYRII